jgi:tetratricopeptide (TPR) repeat protein
MALLLFLPALARAEADPVRGKALFDQAIAAFNAGHFAAALASFDQSYAANPMPTVRYNMAMCQRALRRFADSVASFRQYLDEGGDSVPAERRTEVCELIAETNADLGVHDPPPAACAPPPPATPRPTSATTPPAATPSGPDLSEDDDPTEGDTTEPPPVRPVPVYRRWWFWVSLVGGAAAVGLATGLGLGLSQPELDGDFRVRLP